MAAGMANDASHAERISPQSTTSIRNAFQDEQKSLPNEPPPILYGVSNHGTLHGDIYLGSSKNLAFNATRRQGDHQASHHEWKTPDHGQSPFKESATSRCTRREGTSNHSSHGSQTHVSCQSPEATHRALRVINTAWLPESSVFHLNKK